MLGRAISWMANNPVLTFAIGVGTAYVLDDPPKRRRRKKKKGKRRRKGKKR